MYKNLGFLELASIGSYIDGVYCEIRLPTMGDKSVETLCTEILFLSILETFSPPFAPNNVDFSIS